MIERLGGIEVRRFLVDFSTLVAVALGQVFGFKRGLEGFGFGPVLVDLLAVFFLSFARICDYKNVGFSPDACAHL